jgi:hypothetical protein
LNRNGRRRGSWACLAAALLLLAAGCGGDGDSTEEPRGSTDLGPNLMDKGPPTNGGHGDSGGPKDTDAADDAGADPGEADGGSHDPGPADVSVDPGPPPPGAGTLELSSSGRSGKLAGSLSMHDGSATLSFEAALDGERKIYVANYTNADGDTVCVVELEDGGRTKLTVGDEEMDGIGPLNVPQLTALTALGRSEAGRALPFVALEIACTLSAGQDDDTDARIAALLFPWQMLIKNSPDFPRVSELVPKASCALLAPMAPADADDVPAEISSFTAPTVLQLAADDPLPHVLGHWPFDGAGAAVKVADLAADWVCANDCVGACGQGCGHQGCSTSFEWGCATNGEGNQTGYQQARLHWLCGSHPGCREQDSCYAQCNAEHGCGEWEAAQCRRGCDTICLSDYCDDTFRCECVAWARGGTPLDRYLDSFTVIEGSAEPDHAQCPPAPGVDSGASDDSSSGEDAGEDTSTGTQDSGGSDPGVQDAASSDAG